MVPTASSRRQPALGKKRGSGVLCFLLVLLIGVGEPVSAAEVADLKITVLSTMLTDDSGVGEWGYSALVEAAGRKILFDTGAKPETVLRNAMELGIDLSTVEEVILSHNHGDHTGGLVTLRRELMKLNPAALSRVHVANGIFLSRPFADGTGERNSLLRVRREYESLGGKFIVHDKPVQLTVGIWFSGPVPRVHPEANYRRQGKLMAAGRVLPDTVPEDAALLIDTPKGIVVLTGCGHAGIVNIAEHARRVIRIAPLEAILGGLHLFDASDATVNWTAGKLRQLGMRHLLAGHCTGVETTWRLRQIVGLSRETAAYGAVGATYKLGSGIDPRSIAR